MFTKTLEKQGEVRCSRGQIRRYQQVENMILQDAPVVPLVHPAVPVLISPRIGGFRPHPVWQMQLEHWWATDSPKQ